MKAKIDKTFELDHPIAKVWDYLSKPEKIVSCVPGAQITEKLDDQNYKGEVNLKFGPVAAKYDGEVKIEKLDAVNHVMLLTGKGLDSKGKGSAGMEMNGALKSLGPAKTEVTYSMEISVTGKLAQFGSRLIQDVSNHLTDEFIQNLMSKLDSDSGSSSSGTERKEQEKETKSLNVLSLIWKLIKGMLARLFGSGKS